MNSKANISSNTFNQSLSLAILNAMVYFLNLPAARAFPMEGYFRLYLCHCRKVPVKRGKETLLVLKQRMTLYLSLHDHYVQIDGLSWTFYVKHSM